MTINLMKQPIECKTALKQSIKDDMEVWRILFNLYQEKGIVREISKMSVIN